MKGDELDRILDRALASYSLREPRAGLSERVMARVQAERPASRSGWWLFAIATAALACLAIAMVMRRPHPPAETLQAIWKPAIRQFNAGQAPNLVGRDFARPMEPANKIRHRPRLVSLPGPSPLTAEERALLAFARQAPEVAQRFAEPDEPLEIEPIEIRPLQIGGLQTGENQ